MRFPTPTLGQGFRGLPSLVAACYAAEMFRQWLFLAVVALPVFVIGGGLAVAAEPSDLPPIDPPGVWHTLTQDDATTDSKCIGNPVTPLCAVETIRACFTRRDDSLCQIGMGLDHLPGLSLTNKRPELSERYRVVSVKKIVSDKLTAH